MSRNFSQGNKSGRKYQKSAERTGEGKQARLTFSDSTKSMSTTLRANQKFQSMNIVSSVAISRKHGKPHRRQNSYISNSTRNGGRN